MKLSKNKKGMAIVSWVLLLGFVIALATGVFIWQIKQTEELSQGMVKSVSGEMGCEGVVFNVVSRDGCSSLTVSNKGYFDIDQFVIRVFSDLGVDAVVDETFVPVKESSVLNVGVATADKVEVIPLVKVSEGLVGCEQKSVEVSCKGLSEIQKVACEEADPNKCELLGGLGIVTCGECCAELGLCCTC